MDKPEKMEEKKKVQRLESKLASSKISVLAETIGNLRNETRFSGAIRLLSELYDRSEDSSIMSMISNFMNDLKESDSRSEVVEEMMKPYKQSTIAMLVSSCWQSGQDYSAYAPQLATLFLGGSYQVALESFTVLEEAVFNVTAPVKKEVMGILMTYKPGSSPDKNSLLKELIKIYS